MNEVDRAEERRQATEHLAEVLAGSTGTAEHPSRMAIATATATGELKWLRLHPHALGAGPRAVGQLVVETVRLATDAAVQRGYNELAKSLGDSMAIAIEGFAGPPPFRTAADAAGQAPYTDAPRTGAPHTGAPRHRTSRTYGGSGTAGFTVDPPPGPPYGGAPQPGQPAYGGGQPSHGGYGGQSSHGGQSSYGEERPEDRRPYGGTIEPPVEEQPAPPFAPTPPPPAQPGRRPRPPVDDDDDAYFADPFGTGGFRR